MADGLRLTWVGHATMLIELDGLRILTDPVLGAHVGPLRRLGPAPDPGALGPIDTVLISHAHLDHFDRASLGRLVGDPLLVVPRGLGPAAAVTGRPIREVTANEQLDLGGVRIRALPARHGRWPLRPAARPIGYLVEGSRGVYFAGDTALYPEMTRLAGHVDVALLPVGRWGPPRGPERLDPATAVDAARLVGARMAIPIHWGTLHVPGFADGRWGWGSVDAGEAFAREARAHAAQLDVRVLRPGDTTDLEPD
jgi:L-ascorbate metabolism protein UlaG (beta-lactamase superfamily)